jgi:competence protein ComEC
MSGEPEAGCGPGTKASEGGAAARAHPLGAAWRAALVLAWVCGTALQLQQAALWPGDAYRLLAAGALALGWATWRLRSLAWPRAAACALRLFALAAAAGLAFGAAGWRADARLADALAPEWEGRDVELVGAVDEMPQVTEDGLRFAFVVESAHAGLPSAHPGGGARADEPRVPTRVWLAWRRAPRDDPAAADPAPPVRAGQRWRLPVRLQLPHGALNPDGFDAELWLFEQGLRATGSVRGPAELLDEGGAPIERARQAMRDRILLAVAEPGAAGVLAALAVGDQAAIGSAGWEVFRDTGVAHLVSISGLHITMLAWLGGGAIGRLWRRAGQAALVLPAPLAARWGGVAVAWGYALFAGWGVPARRTVLMLAATALLRTLGRDWPALLVTLAAMVPVTALDPWALLQPGFWLSFAAVGLLMASAPVRAAPTLPLPVPAPGSNPGPGAPAGGAAPGAPGAAGAPAAGLVARAIRALGRAARESARAQVVACLGLAPLTLVAFEQVSLVGLLANLVAEPWITLVVTPLALAGGVLPPLWQVGALALRPLLAFLEILGAWPWASVHVAAAPAWGLVAGLAGGALLVLPVPWRLRALGLPLLLPLLAPCVPRPPPGRFELVAADVGQGSAVLVRTRAHLLLFDTGPRFGPDDDAGRRMLLPLLHARGETRVDALVLSHADADHVGGARAVLAGLPVGLLRSSLAAGHPLRGGPVPHARCEAGQAWAWDGVRFEMLHPDAAGYRPGVKTNAVSCVLRVADAAGRSALLPGDIEAPQEDALLARAPGALRSDVLLVPHHGSRTSSTAAFLAAARPRSAVIQVGYRSRYGHPAPQVLDRYEALGIAVVRSDHCGAWSWDGDEAHCTRDVRRRYWQWSPGRAPRGGPGRPAPGARPRGPRARRQRARPGALVRLLLPSGAGRRAARRPANAAGARHGFALRRDARRARCGARALPRLRALARAPERRADARAARPGGDDLPPRGHHLRGVWRQGGRRRRGYRAPDPVRPDPPRDSGARMARSRARAAPARHRPQPLHP